MGKLSINLYDYESKLEKLNNFVEKMSHIVWTSESAMQFLEDQGVQIEDYVRPRFVNLQITLSDLNKIDYKSIKDKIAAYKQQAVELKHIKFDDYNESYQNYINAILSSVYKQINVFLNISLVKITSMNILVILKNNCQN